MIVGIVTPFVYPHDQEIRVRKIANSLKQLGHDVHILCGSNGASFEFVDQDGIVVHRINILSGVPLLHRIINIPVPINPAWYFWLFWMCKRLSIDVLIARDLRLSLPTAIIGKILGLRAIADFGENFPAMHRFLGRGKLIIHIIILLEKLVVQMVDYVFVVTEENKWRLCNADKTRVDKIHVLTNVPEISQLQQWGKTIPLESFQSMDGILKLVFIGLVDQFRGLELVLEALSYLDKDIKFQLTIVGDGPYLSHIQKVARQKGLEKNIEYKGWISEGKYRELLNHHIGLIPHVDCELTQSTMPNKSFDYMSVGLPFITTDLQPVSNLVRECKCGWVVPHDPLALSNLLKDLVTNPAEMYLRGQNGYLSVTEKYNWEYQSKETLKYVGIDGN